MTLLKVTTSKNSGLNKEMLKLRIQGKSMNTQGSDNSGDLHYLTGPWCHFKHQQPVRLSIINILESLDRAGNVHFLKYFPRTAE